jgi:excisionase family DNA binding protein
VSVDPDGSCPQIGASRLTSVAEAARMLGISRTLAYELVARQELPSVRFGNRVYVLRRDVLLLVGASDDEPVVEAGARPAGRAAGGRTQPAPGSASAPPPAKGPELRPQGSRRRRPHPEPETQMTLFEPTDQPTTATPPDPPSRPIYRSSPRSSSETPSTRPDRALPPSNQPDALAPGVRRDPVNVAGSRAGGRSALNGSLDREAGSGC